MGADYHRGSLLPICNKSSGVAPLNTVADNGL